MNHLSTVGPLGGLCHPQNRGPRLRQPYLGQQNAPVVAFHRGHIVRKNPSGPPATANQIIDRKQYQERKWDRGRGLELAQRLEQSAKSATLGAPTWSSLGAGTLRSYPWLSLRSGLGFGQQSEGTAELPKAQARSEAEPRIVASSKVADPLESATLCTRGCNPVRHQAGDACRLRPPRVRMGGVRPLGPHWQAQRCAASSQRCVQTPSIAPQYGTV